jgi:hypothetical protein
MSDGIDYGYSWHPQLRAEMRNAPPETRQREPISSRYGTGYGDSDRAIEAHNRWIGNVEAFTKSTRPRRQRAITGSGLSQADLDQAITRSVQTRATYGRIEQAKATPSAEITPWQARRQAARQEKSAWQKAEPAASPGVRPAVEQRLGELKAARRAADWAEVKQRVGAAFGLRSPSFNDRRQSAGGLGRRETPGSVTLHSEPEQPGRQAQVAAQAVSEAPERETVGV